ncbi:MAG: hypothetical protein HY606_07010, partial [Planctomycetes bacterium]|nr:hypothetical protein [Planctomycetota bacterium]
MIKGKFVGFILLLLVPIVLLLIVGIIAKCESNSTQNSNNIAQDFQVDSFDDFKKLALALRKTEDAEVESLQQRISMLEEQLKDINLQSNDYKKIQDKQFEDDVIKLGDLKSIIKSETGGIDNTENPTGFSQVKVNDLQVINLNTTKKQKLIHVPSGTFARAT